MDQLIRYIHRYTWPASVLIIGILLFLFQLVATPLLNSGDDAFLLYTLAGGYGEAPSSLLHYNEIIHPAIGYFIRELFVAAPGTNWYTLMLLGFHWVATTIILYILIRKLLPVMAFLFFAIFFFFLETRLLLSLNVTGTAMLAGTAALGLLCYQLEKSRLKSKNTVVAVLLFVLAGMLRLQVAWLLMIIFLPFVVTRLDRKQFKQWMMLCSVIFFILFSLNKFHEHYYKQNIPGWEKQEAFRQALFYGYNRPVKQDNLAGIFKDSTEQQLFFSGFLYDTTRFSTERVKSLSRSITRKRLLNENEDRQGLYWFFIELRIYILLFGIVLTGLWLQRKKTIIKKWTFSFLAVAAVYGYLFVYMKITTPLHLGLLAMLWLHLVWQFREGETFLPTGKIQRGLLSLLLVLLFAWMGIRMAEENMANRQKQERFRCSVAEINLDRQRLFVATTDVFPMGYFSVWDVPADYPVHNLVYKDRMLAGNYMQTLQRYGISDLETAIFDNENVYLLGPVLPALERLRPSGLTTGRFPAYKCLEVRKLVQAE